MTQGKKFAAFILKHYLFLNLSCHLQYQMIQYKHALAATPAQLPLNALQQNNKENFTNTGTAK